MSYVVKLFAQQVVYRFNLLSICKVFERIIPFEILSVAELGTHLLELFGRACNSFSLFYHIFDYIALLVNSELIDQLSVSKSRGAL